MASTAHSSPVPPWPRLMMMAGGLAAGTALGWLGWGAVPASWRGAHAPAAQAPATTPRQGNATSPPPAQRREVSQLGQRSGGIGGGATANIPTFNINAFDLPPPAPGGLTVEQICTEIRGLGASGAVERKVLETRLKLLEEQGAAGKQALVDLLSSGVDYPLVEQGRPSTRELTLRLVVLEDISGQEHTAQWGDLMRATLRSSPSFAESLLAAETLLTWKEPLADAGEQERLHRMAGRTLAQLPGDAAARSAELKKITLVAANFGASHLMPALESEYAQLQADGGAGGYASLLTSFPPELQNECIARLGIDHPLLKPLAGSSITLGFLDAAQPAVFEFIKAHVAANIANGELDIINLARRISSDRARSHQRIMSTGVRFQSSSYRGDGTSKADLYRAAGMELLRMVEADPAASEDLRGRAREQRERWEEMK